MEDVLKAAIRAKQDIDKVIIMGDKAVVNWLEHENEYCRSYGVGVDEVEDEEPDEETWEEDNV